MKKKFDILLTNYFISKHIASFIPAVYSKVEILYWDNLKEISRLEICQD